MDLSWLESALRRAWSRLQTAIPDPVTRATVEHELEAAGRAAFGPSFRFVPTPPDAQRKRPALTVLRGERPSERFIPDDEPEAG